MKRKIEKHRDKVLRTDSLLHKNPFVQPVSSSKPKKFNKKLEKIPNANANANETGDGSKVNSAYKI